MELKRVPIALVFATVSGCAEPAATAASPVSPAMALPPPASPRAPPPPAPTPAVPTLVPKEVVILDPGAQTKGPNVKLLVGANKLSAAEHTRILDAIFGVGRYLKDSKSCRGTGWDLASSRRTGDFAPSVFEVATGSFTNPDAKQALYLITTGECGATHVDDWGSTTLAVIDDTAVVAKENIVGGSSLQGVFDIDGDGKDEVLTTQGFTNQGSTTESATLCRFENGKLVEVKSFGEVYSANCDAGFDPKKEEYTVVRAVVRPGTPPAFKMEKKSRPCH
jgi:hypothetical protein